MINKTLASKPTCVTRNHQLEELHPLKALGLLVALLSRELSMKPEIYEISQEESVRIFFPDSGYELGSLSEEYGDLMGAISLHYPLRLVGLLDGLEEGELRLEEASGQILLGRYNTTGKYFDHLSDLCFHLSFSSSEERGLCCRLLSNLDAKLLCAALPRGMDCKEFAPIFEPESLTYFRYVMLEEAEEYYLTLLGVLSVSQLTELWISFLEEGTDYAEFEYLYEVVKQELPVSIFKWEISLKLAMARLGITAAFEGNSFEVRDKNGTRRHFDFNTPSSAEKLFLKILFPAKATK